MSNYPTPSNETERQAELDTFNVLDTLPEEDYDNIANLASYICQTPISLITMIDHDRQWFKSHPSIEPSETSRNEAFCSHTIMNPEEILEVEDLREDTRFQNFSTVKNDPSLVFYAGAPLQTSNGIAIGSICVLDTKPRKLTAEQKKALVALSRQVVALLELRKTTDKYKSITFQLEERNEMLEKFAQIAAHDLKSPLSLMTTTVDMLNSAFANELSADAQESLEDLKQSALHLGVLIDDILQYSRSGTLLHENKQSVDLLPLLKQITKEAQQKDDCSFSFEDCSVTLTTHATALELIVRNLVSNALKHSNKPNTEVTIRFKEEESQYIFTVKDNGKGIKKTDQAKIFDMFVKLQSTDKYDKPSTGIGLHTVKNLVEGLDGTIVVESEPEIGTTFTFTIKK